MPIPLPIQSVNHIAWVTPQIERMAAFYRDVLGFRQIWRPNFSFGGIWLFGYGLQIHLIEPRSGSPAQAFLSELSVRDDHVAFHAEVTRDIGPLLEQHGIPYKTNYVADSGVTQYFFQDPDGNHIEIGTYPPPVDAGTRPS